MGKRHREWLLVREAGQPDVRVEVTRWPLRIGRGPGNQIVLRDSYASTEHAELLIEKGRPSVRDLGSTNGTRLNGVTLAPRRTWALEDGDVVEIGESALTYRDGQPSRRATGPADERQMVGDALVPTHTSVVGLAYPPSAGEAECEERPARQRSWAAGARRLVVRLVLILLLVACLVAASVWLLAPPRVALLVLGSDARPDELRRGEGGRTDTLLAVVADRSPSGIALISIPRDLWLEIPGHGSERINAAYALGGPGASKRVVSDLLGIAIERHLLIGLQGVRDVVDAAGGVEIDVERPIHDDAYPTDDYGTIVLDIPAGRQHMDGETALRYARTRHQDNDFGRMARQQRVMLAVRSALLRPINWWRIPAVLTAVRRATQTDLGPLDLATLAIAFGAGSREPDRLAIDLSLVQEFQGGGGAYLLRPTPALRQRVAAFLEPTSAAVEILNGTSTPGLAKQVADRLQSEGMRTVTVGNAGRTQASTTIEIRPGLRRAGAAVSMMLDVPAERVRESADLPAGVDVRVTLGG